MHLQRMGHFLVENAVTSPEQSLYIQLELCSFQRIDSALRTVLFPGISQVHFYAILTVVSSADVLTDLSKILF